MDDRIAKHLLENNVLQRIAETERKVAHLQKMSVASGSESADVTIINNSQSSNSSVFFLNETASDIATYKTLLQAWADIAAGTSTKTSVADLGYDIIQEFSMPAFGIPIFINGDFNLDAYVSSDVITSVYLNAQLYLRDSGGTEELISTCEIIAPLTTAVTKQTFSAPIIEGGFVSQVVDVADRFILKILVASTVDADITISFGDATYPAVFTIPYFPPNPDDGGGTGDVISDSTSSAVGNIVTMSGTDGKHVQDGGTLVSEIAERGSVLYLDDSGHGSDLSLTADFSTVAAGTIVKNVVGSTVASFTEYFNGGRMGVPKWLGGIVSCSIYMSCSVPQTARIGILLLASTTAIYTLTQQEVYIDSTPTLVKLSWSIVDLNPNIIDLDDELRIQFYVSDSSTTADFTINYGDMDYPSLLAVSFMPPGAGSGSGDMLKAIYDPNDIAADVFDTDNHVDGDTNAVYTLAERLKLSGIEAGAEVNDIDSVTDTSSIDLTITAKALTADVKTAGVTLAMLANMAQDSLFYRKSAGAGAPEVNSLATLKTDLQLAALNVAAIHTDIKEPTGWLDPDAAAAALTYDSTTQKFTLTGTHYYYWRGVKSSVTDFVSTAHTNTVGHTYYLSTTDGTNFTWATDSIWTFDVIMIGSVDYQTAYKIGMTETHGLMEWQVHEELHRAIGSFKESGGTLDPASYALASTTATNRRPDVVATHIHDEDIDHVLPALTSKNYQKFSLSGTDTVNFSGETAEIISVTGAKPNYNLYTGGAWTQAAMANNTYTCVWLVAVPVTQDAASQAYRFLWVQGQSAGTLAAQQALTTGDLYFGTLTDESPEFVVLLKIIINYVGPATNDWRITSVTNISGTRYSQVSQAAGAYLSGVTTDATLTGNGSLASPLSIVGPETGLADGAYSGDSEAGTAGAALAFGELVYLQTSDSRWEKVDASARATCSNRIGICVLAAAGDGSATRILSRGNVRADAAFPTMDIGGEMYASTTAGAIEGTPPSSNAGEIIRHVGHANTANELHFNPSGIYYEIGV